MSVAHCPMCHLANEAIARDCDRCGYEFGQSIETLRDLLDAQLHRAWAMLLVMLLVDALMVGTTIYCALVLDRVVVPGLGFIFAVWWTLRTVHKIGVTRHSLKLIAARELPRATLLPPK